MYVYIYIHIFMYIYILFYPSILSYFDELTELYPCTSDVHPQ